MVLLQLAFCSPPYDYVSLLCNVSGLLREGQRELSVCFLDRSQASSPSSSSTSSSVSCQVTEGQTSFSCSTSLTSLSSWETSSYISELKFLVNLAKPGHKPLLHVCFSRPYCTSVTLFLAKLSFSAAEKKDPKVWSNVVCERISLFSAPSFQGSWVPGWWHHRRTCALIEV